MFGMIEKGQWITFGRWFKGSGESPSSKDQVGRQDHPIEIFADYSFQWADATLHYHRYGVLDNICW